MGYEWDLFISYRRKPGIRAWVLELLRPQLEEWLAETVAYEPKLFVDESIETGATWPEALRVAISKSRLLVPVLTATYFRSAWCLAELETMFARENLLGLRAPGTAEGLILPILWAGRELFPEHVAQIQHTDFTAWAYRPPFFTDSAHNVAFQGAVKDFAEKVARRLTCAPEWQEGWPIRLPRPAAPSEFRLPRLR
jgi:hypothetical protein